MRLQENLRRASEAVIEAGAELGVGVTDQELWRDALFFAPHQRVAGLLGHPCICRCGAEDAAAAEMDEHQHIGRFWPTQCEHGLREEVAGDHGFHMRADECGPGQGGLLLAPLRARVDACPQDSDLARGSGTSSKADRNRCITVMGSGG